MLTFSEQKKFIFIHIPKCAGSSIKDHFFKGVEVDWKTPNYDLLYGWCPQRKLHLQHATARQLVEEGLVSEENWKEYYKFTFVRNPWDRAYSDYLWIMKDSGVRGTFEQYMHSTGPFEELFTNQETKNYRGDHKTLQTEFFGIEGHYKLDFLGRFETLVEDMGKLKEYLNFSTPFQQHSKKNVTRKEHYSFFYGKRERELVEYFYKEDIRILRYSFDNKNNGFQRIKDLF